MTSTQRKFIHDLMAELLGLGKNKVVWANQNMPKPGKPFATLRLYSSKGQAHEEIRKTDKSDVYRVLTPTDAYLEVQLYDDATSPYEQVEAMVQSLWRPTIADRCAAMRIAFFDAGDILQMDAPLDNTRYEHRAVVDLNVRYHRMVKDVIDPITEVVIDGRTADRSLPIDVKSE